MTEQERLQAASLALQEVMERFGVAINITMSARAFRGATYEDFGGVIQVRQGNGVVQVEPVGVQFVCVSGWQPPVQQVIEKKEE